MRPSLRQLFPLVALAAAGSGFTCEPPDGGGGGLGFKLAVIRSERLLVSDDDGSNERTVTMTGSAQDPAVFGQTIAFVSAETTSSSSRALYRTAFLAGAPVEKLADPSPNESFESPAWAPDGLSLVVVVSSGATTRLARVPAEGGEAEEIANAPSGKLFPTFIGEDELLVVDAVTKELEVVTLSSGAISRPVQGTTLSRPTASRDGARVAFSDAADGGRLVVVDVRTGARTPLGALDMSTSQPAFSPDGKFVGFVSSSLVYALPSDGSNESPVLLQSGTNFAWGT
jgi:Tol biopolymer transport system component